jgi:TetR/AcrR family transcriptional regulator, regulator of autoinduction and epiphytic fitness
MQTRERILAAAAKEFARGYAATSIRTIAERAGVSVPTIELAFGTKAQLLQAAIRFSIRGDADPRTMLDRPWTDEATNASSAGEFLEIFARTLVEGEQRSADLVIAAFEAATQDGSMKAVSEHLFSQRAQTAAWLVDGLSARARLRGELTRERAIDTVWLLMDPRGYQALTRDRGWTPERFREWFIGSVHRLLVADERTPVGAKQGIHVAR